MDLKEIKKRASQGSSEDAVADRAVLLERIEQLDKETKGLIAREMGLLLLAQSLTGVSFDAVRGSAKSKLEGEFPQIVGWWEF